MAPPDRIFLLHFNACTLSYVFFLFSSSVQSTILYHPTAMPFTPARQDGPTARPVAVLGGDVSAAEMLFCTPDMAQGRREALSRTLGECHEALARLRMHAGASMLPPHMGGARGLSSAAPAAVPAPPLSAAVVASASMQLCRPYSSEARALWSDVTAAAHSLAATSTATAPHFDVTPPPAVEAPASPGDDDALAGALMLDILLSSSYARPSQSLSEADWVIAGYLDRLAVQLGAAVPLAAGGGGPAAHAAVMGQRPPQHTTPYFARARPNTAVAGVDARKGGEGGAVPSPSGFYDSLVDAARDRSAAPLAVLDRYLADASALYADANASALRSYFLSQRSVAPANNGAATVASLVADGGRGGGLPLGQGGALGGMGQPPLAKAATVTAAAVSGAAAVLASSSATVSDALAKAALFVKQSMGAHEAVAGGGGVPLAPSAADVYGALCAQLVHTSREREKQERAATEAGDNNSSTNSDAYRPATTFGPLLTAALTEVQRGAAVALPPAPAVPAVGQCQLGEAPMANLFIALNVLRRLAAFGLSAFVNGSSRGASPHAECFHLLRAHAPEVMPAIAERLRAQHAARPIIGAAATAPNGTGAATARPLGGGAGAVVCPPQVIADPVGHLLTAATTQNPSLAFLSPILHRFSSSVPALSAGAAPSASSGLPAVAPSLRSGALPIGYGSPGATVVLSPPTDAPVLELLTALHERVGDDAGGAEGSSLSGSSQQLQRLLIRNAALERENDELRRGLHTQAQLLQHLAGQADANPLREMAAVQSQLVSTLHDVTAALKASRDATSLL